MANTREILVDRDHYLPTPQGIEVIAMQLWRDDQHLRNQLQEIDRLPTWEELTREDRMHYRFLAVSLLREYVD